MTTSFKAVCDAWLSDLQTYVTGLDTTTIPTERVHLYTSWSLEAQLATSGERHIGIWPEGEPEVVNAAIAATFPSDLAEASYIVTVWEDASSDSARVMDDEVAGAAWLALAEAIRDRFYVMANIQLGSVDATRYAGMGFDFRAGCRIMQIRFRTRVLHSFS